MSFVRIYLLPGVCIGYFSSLSRRTRQLYTYSDADVYVGEYMCILAYLLYGPPVYSPKGKIWLAITSIAASCDSESDKRHVTMSTVIK